MTSVLAFLFLTSAEETACSTSHLIFRLTLTSQTWVGFPRCIDLRHMLIVRNTFVRSKDVQRTCMPC